jgi:hypothetical protein
MANAVPPAQGFRAGVEGITKRPPFSLNLPKIPDFTLPQIGWRVSASAPIGDLTPRVNAVFLYVFGETALNFPTHDLTI